MTADGNLEKRIKAYSITKKKKKNWVLFALGTIMQTCKLWTWKEELNDIKNHHLAARLAVKRSIPNTNDKNTSLSM